MPRHLTFHPNGVQTNKMKVCMHLHLYHIALWATAVSHSIETLEFHVDAWFPTQYQYWSIFSLRYWEQVHTFSPITWLIAMDCLPSDSYQSMTMVNPTAETAELFVQNSLISAVFFSFMDVPYFSLMGYTLGITILDHMYTDILFLLFLLTYYVSVP